MCNANLTVVVTSFFALFVLIFQVAVRSFFDKTPKNIPAVSENLLMIVGKFTKIALIIQVITGG